VCAVALFICGFVISFFADLYFVDMVCVRCKVLRLYFDGLGGIYVVVDAK